MLIEALSAADFRNIAKAHIEPHPRFNIFAGKNGQGKTNLLEAIYLLSAVKSFRPQTNRDLIRFGAESARLEARVERGGSQRIVSLEIGERGKKVFLNENPVRNLQDFFGTINIVIFGPDDVLLLKGSPSGRRRFLDRAIFNGYPGYAYVTSQFDDVLKQRNALLKDGRIDAVLLSTYDEQFIQYGAEIVERRLSFLSDFRELLVATFAEIFDADLEPTLSYGSKWLDDGVTDRRAIEKNLERELDRTRNEERDRRHTVVGPHRDDLETFLDGKDVKSFGSQGQHRGFVLALKIAEIRFLESRFHFAPILLLDDVSSELDRDRNRFLFEFLKSRMEGQVFITTTHRDHILLDEELKSFSVWGGEIEET